jgi:hypothetical protein
MLAPVVLGIAVGVGFIVLFGLSSIPQSNSFSTMPDRVWMGRTPTQCAEPWDADEWRQKANGTSANAMTGYLESKGVTVYEIKVVEQSEFDGQILTIYEEPFGRCEGCHCLDWDTIFVQVPLTNIDEMQAIGFASYDGESFLIGTVTIAGDMPQVNSLQESSDLPIR